MKLSDFGLCKPVDVSLLPTLTEGEEYSDARLVKCGIRLWAAFNSCFCHAAHLVVSSGLWEGARVRPRLPHSAFANLRPIVHLSCMCFPSCPQLSPDNGPEDTTGAAEPLAEEPEAAGEIERGGWGLINQEGGVIRKECHKFKISTSR